MRVFRSWGPEPGEGAAVAGCVAEAADGWQRQHTAELTGVPRCPRCGGELVARMGRAAPGFSCRCPVRRVRAA